ncbi:MAG: nucleotide exchange factor GrpE, partial [Gammaproteobacteria bacterium]
DKPEHEPSEIMLQHELEQAKAQAQEYLEGWQRARAEFANYKKRVARDQEDARQRIAADTLMKYLGVIDDLERALKERPDDGEAEAWAEGIELIYRKMSGVLETEGVEVIDAEGENFDPTMHEAISHDESEEHEEGEVIEVVQPGYRLGERVLRPAMVRVAK